MVQVIKIVDHVTLTLSPWMTGDAGRMFLEHTLLEIASSLSGSQNFICLLYSFENIWVFHQIVR